MSSRPSRTPTSLALHSTLSIALGGTSTFLLGSQFLRPRDGARFMRFRDMARCAARRPAGTPCVSAGRMVVRLERSSGKPMGNKTLWIIIGVIVIVVMLVAGLL